MWVFSKHYWLLFEAENPMRWTRAFFPKNWASILTTYWYHQGSCYKSWCSGCTEKNKLVSGVGPDICICWSSLGNSSVSPTLRTTVPPRSAAGTGAVALPWGAVSGALTVPWNQVCISPTYLSLPLLPEPSSHLALVLLRRWPRWWDGGDGQAGCVAVECRGVWIQGGEGGRGKAEAAEVKGGWVPITPSLPPALTFLPLLQAQISLEPARLATV